MATIVLANQKGGVGKTTLACTLAWWLSERQRKRVLFVDLDAQGNASRTLGPYASGLVSLALFEQQVVDLQPSAAPIVLIASSAQLSDIDQQPQAPARFRTNLERLAQPFDIVVIDTPPALGRRMIAALIAADGVVCPIELEEYSIDGAAAMLKTIHAVRQRWNPGLRCLGLLPNRFNHHSAAQKSVLQRLLSEHRSHVLPARIATRSSIPLSLAQGVPVWRLPQSAAREATEELERAFGLVWQRMCTTVDEEGAHA